jgi:hypothetical protein
MVGAASEGAGGVFFTVVFAWTGLTIDCVDPQRLAVFWAALLNRPITAEMGVNASGPRLAQRGTPATIDLVGPGDPADRRRQFALTLERLTNTPGRKSGHVCSRSRTLRCCDLRCVSKCICCEADRRPPESEV